MTWKQFKEQVESLGVKDTDEIGYIDVSFPYKLLVERNRDDDDIIDITE